MGNSTQVIVTRGADQTSVPLICTIESESESESSSSGGTRYATQVVVVAGASPSYAFIGVPEVVPMMDSLGSTVALKNTVANELKLNSRARVTYSEGGKNVNLICGTLVENGHTFNPAEDSVVAQIFDDRYLMAKTTAGFGRVIWDPSTAENGSAGNVYFDENQHTVFNQFGWPDCLDHPVLGPVFAPAMRFGWKQSDSYEPSSGAATTKARSWTGTDALTYLMNHHGADAIHPLPKNDIGTYRLPHNVEWKAEVNTFEGSDRTLKDVSIENLSLLDACQLIARKCGPIDVYTQPIQNGFDSKVMFISQNPKSGGSIFHFADYSNDSIEDAMNGNDVIHSGYLKESIVNYFDDVCICGDAPAVERFCTTEAESLGSINGMPTLEKAWEKESEDAFKKYMIQNKGTLDAFHAARNIWPDVWTAFRVARGVPVFNGTKWSGTALGCRYPKIKNHQLTGYNSGVTNPKNFQPKEIVVEYKLSQWEYDNLTEAQKAKGWWRTANKYDNLTLSPDQTIVYFGALADTTVGALGNQSWFSNDDPLKSGKGTDASPAGLHGVEDAPDGKFDGRVMTRREIRCNLAIEHDTVLTGRCKDDPNHTATRINQNGPRYTYLSVAQPMDYVEYLRINSRPNGEAFVYEPYKTANFPDKSAEGNEFFTDRTNATTGRLPDHAVKRNADTRRIDYSGELIQQRINPGVYVGLPITIDGNNTIPIKVIVKGVIWDNSKSGVTRIMLGNPDTKEIYDSVQSQGSYANGSTSGSVPSSDETYDDDTYIEEKQTVKETKKSESGYGGDSGSSGNDGNNGAGERVTRESTKEKSTVERRKMTKEEQQTHKEEKAKKASEKLDKDIQSAKDSDDFKGQNRLEKEKRAIDKRKEVKDSNAAAKKAQLAESPYQIGNWLGKPSGGSINGKTSITNSLFGAPSSGSATSGGQGQTHRNWDTNKTRDGENAKGQMKDNSKYDMNDPNNPTLKRVRDQQAAAKNKPNNSSKYDLNNPDNPTLKRVREEQARKEAQKQAQKQAERPKERAVDINPTKTAPASSPVIKPRKHEVQPKDE